MFALVALTASRPGPDSVLVPLADGFDYPVGKPEGTGYRTARGFWPGKHPGEDWNGAGGGNSDLGDPVYAIAHGVVVASDDYRAGWGNCVIVRHAYRDKTGQIRMVDSQYAHLDRRTVRLYQVVKRGDQVGTIGTAHGVYYAHLHFELRRNLRIGMNRSQFPRDYNHYYNPTPFIRENRTLRTSSRRYPIPTKTFAAYGETEIPEAPTRAPGSLVPVRTRELPTGGRLDPELEKIIEQNRADAPSDEEMESFWSKLRDRLRAKPKPGGGG
jgi:murein DD-endopeptidase MepM/ murein hydrolase activator NlpD